MSKRTREQEAAVVVGDGKAAGSVLGMRDLVAGVLAVHVEALADLWNLYHTCASTLRALHDHPDIALRREARMHYHGEMRKPLKDALKRGDARLGRCLVAHLETRGALAADMFWGVRRAACGISMEYVLIVARFCKPLRKGLRQHVGDYVRLLAGSLSAGNADHFRRVREWFAVQKLKVDDEKAFFRAIQQGLPELALEIIPLDESMYHGYAGADIGVVPPFIASFVQSAFKCVSTRSLEFCAAHWPVVVDDYVQRFPDVSYTFLGLKWAASYAHRRGLGMDYEDIHMQLRERHRERSRKERLILEWLTPLALASFSERYARDKTAQPYFGRRYDAYTYRMHGLGLVYNKFPGLQDSLHYAYRHPANPVHMKMTRGK